MAMRETKFSNDIIYNLLQDYKVTDIKILSVMVNRLITKYKSLENEEAEDNIDLEIGISLDFFKKYKGKKKLTVSEIISIIDKISTFGIKSHTKDIYKKINIISNVEYNKRYKSFKICFNHNAIDYLVEVYKKFTLIDLEEVKDFSSKYELGLYILISMYKNTGKIIKNIEDLKIFFNMKNDTKILMNNLRNAKAKLYEKLGYKIKFTPIKAGRKIERLEIKFERKII